MFGGRRVVSVGAFLGGFVVAAAAQAPTADLLAILPDDTEAVLSVTAPEQAVLAFAAALLPVPAGLPPDVVAWLGAGAAFVQAGLRGTLAETAAAVAGDGLVLGVQPGTPRPGLPHPPAGSDDPPPLCRLRRFAVSCPCGTSAVANQGQSEP